MISRSTPPRARPLTARECRILDRIGRDRTHKDIAAELSISINTVANLPAKAYRKLGAHGAAAAVLAHRDAHQLCDTRVDFGPILEHIVAARSRRRERRALNTSPRSRRYPPRRSLRWSPSDSRP